MHCKEFFLPLHHWERPTLLSVKTNHSVSLTSFQLIGMRNGKARDGQISLMTQFKALIQRFFFGKLTPSSFHYLLPPQKYFYIASCSFFGNIEKGHKGSGEIKKGHKTVSSLKRLSNRRGGVGRGWVSRGLWVVGRGSWVVGRGFEISHVNTSLYIYFYAARNSGFLCNLFLAWSLSDSLGILPIR